MPIQIIKAPSKEEFIHKKSIFLAGPMMPDWEFDWRYTVIEELKNEDITVINPVRYDLSWCTPHQKLLDHITWEYKMIKQSKGIICWFPKQSVHLVPTLELGQIMELPKLVWVGCAPEFEDRACLECQVNLRRTDSFYPDFSKLIETVKKDIKEALLGWAW